MFPVVAADVELEQQRAEIGDVFRAQWPSLDPASVPPDPYTRRVITEAEVIIIGGGTGRRVAVLFPHPDFPGVHFGHRFEAGPADSGVAARQFIGVINDGALHRMMDRPPSRDSASIVWTTWGTPSTDAELQSQRSTIGAAFEGGWRPVGAGQPRVLSERDYTDARRIVDQGGWTGLDLATIHAVRDGARPGDALPPLQPRPYISHVTDADVFLHGSGSGRRVAVRFRHAGFPRVRFGHRFPLDPFCHDYESIWLKEKIETGALHRMMTSPPPTDAAGLVWTTWGSPAS